MKSLSLWSLTLTLAVTTAMSGCTTTGGIVGSHGAETCNPGMSAALGAIVGGALGATRNGATAVKGAVAGAAVGALACMAVNFHSRQTHDAATVEAEYKRKHANTLPAVPTVTAYETSVEPRAQVMAGQNVEVRSNLKIVDGTQQHVSSVREELVLLDTNGKEFRRVGKDVQSKAGGGYENSFSFAFPKGVSQGIYKMHTELLVNGQVAAHSGEQLQLVVEYVDSPYQVASR
jgi:hypothetical protein